MIRSWPRIDLLAGIFALGACAAPPADSTPTPTPTPAPLGCRAAPAPDGDRRVLAALPYDDGGGQQDVWVSMRLGLDGVLHDDGVRWTAPRSNLGRLRWTPDGSLGFAASDDGRLAVFDADGGQAEAGDWYAEDVLIDPSGERLWIVDPNWAENGGGLWEAAIGCDDGALGPAVKVTPSKLASRLLAHPGGPLLVHVDEATAEVVVSRFDADAGALTALATVLPDDALVADAALSWDGDWLAVADNSEWSAGPNRVALVEIATGDVQVVQSNDPVALLPSPDGRFLAIDGYGNSGRWIERTGATWAVGATPTWQGARPALPGVGAWIGRGALRGLALIGETAGVRGFDLAAGEDLGLLWTDESFAGIVGAVGLQP